MISPEILRRFPIFAALGNAERKAVAMVSEEQSIAAGDTVFVEGESAQALYVLAEGAVDLEFENPAEGGAGRTRLRVGEISAGEPFGLSALIEPYKLKSTARAHVASRVLRIDASSLRAIAEVDPRVGYALMRQVARAAYDRLEATRVQLAAARA
jgi:CRP-like cAMP-binding protein